MVDYIVDIPQKENQILYHSPYGEYHIIFNQRNGNERNRTGRNRAGAGNICFGILKQCTEATA